MFEEMSSAGAQGNSVAQEKTNVAKTGTNQVQTILSKNTQDSSMGSVKNSPKSMANNSQGNSSKTPYPRSYGTDIVPGTMNGEKNQMSTAGVNDSDLSQNGQNGEYRGTILTEVSTGPQHIDEYSFEFSPETNVDNVLIDDFKSFALNNQMSVKTAKQVASFYEGFMQKTNANYAANAKMRDNDMRQACEHDTELGGARYNENVRHAQAAMSRFGNDSLVKILGESGFGSHPEVVRFMSRVGKSLGEKNMVMGQSVQKELSAAELFYPSMRRR